MQQPLPEPLIGQAPPFNPHQVTSRRPRGMRRSWRLWGLVAGLILVGAGAFVAQRWASSWTPEAKAKLRVETSQIEPPGYKIEASLPAPVMKQDTAPPIPKQAAEAPQQQPQRAITRPGPPARPRPLPTAISWNVQPQGEPPQDWFADGRRPMLAKGCALRPGASLIPAVLNTVIESEIPGQVIATTSEDVFDVDGVGRLLVPQGTKLVGLYKSDLSLGSRRLGMVWTELTMPDGTQLALDNANGMDVAGSMGVGGTVTTAWGQVIFTAALFSIFDAAQRSAVPDGTYANDLAAASANQFSRTGQQVVTKMLEQAVKIRIPAGTQIEVSVGKTVQVC
jgi:type IV secretory pathway VirB10-like protein